MDKVEFLFLDFLNQVSFKVEENCPGCSAWMNLIRILNHFSWNFLGQPEQNGYESEGEIQERSLCGYS